VIATSGLITGKVSQNINNVTVANDGVMQIAERAEKTLNDVIVRLARVEEMILSPSKECGEPVSPDCPGIFNTIGRIERGAIRASTILREIENKLGL
jgi:hypothetical protein